MKRIFILVFLFVGLIGYSQEKRDIYNVVEIMPEPVNGKSAFFEWVEIKSKELKEKYQIECKKGEAQIIFMGFQIDTSGNIINPKVHKGIRQEIDEEALELVRTMDLEWKPGIHRGEKVLVQMHLPFTLCPKSGMNKKKKKNK